ncbi:hypothetical protein Bbelb_048340 [Branchiostoma belcheri]|nr:hypothetical protein Bbelb_048340 [Branchiostoma belcheri]
MTSPPTIQSQHDVILSGSAPVPGHVLCSPKPHHPSKTRRGEALRRQWLARRCAGRASCFGQYAEAEEMAAGRIESRSMQYWGTRRSTNGTASHADEIFVLPFYLATRAMEEYREDFAFEESIENEAVCQIRKQIYEKRTVKVIKHLSLLQQDFCTRLALRAVRTEDSRHHCN